MKVKFEKPVRLEKTPDIMTKLIFRKTELQEEMIKIDNALEVLNRYA